MFEGFRRSLGKTIAPPRFLLFGVVFVLATNYIGIYVSAAIYIGAFMVFFGKFAVWKALAVSLGIAIVNFMMFEVWFLVPLPKGPLETALGY